MTQPIAKGTTKPLGASYWREIAGRGPTPMDAEIRSLLICPDDDAPLEWPESGADPVCPHCSRKFPRENGYLDILPTSDNYALSSEAIAALEATEPTHPVTADPAEVYGPIWKQVEEVLGDPKGKLILDACCGTGFVARWLVERGARVVALDVVGGSSGLGALANWQKPEGAVLELVRGDVCRIPFQSAGFDAVFLGGAISIQARPEKLLTESSRVICDGGLVFALGEEIGRGGSTIISGGDPRREGHKLSLTDYIGIFGEGQLSLDCHLPDAPAPNKKAGMIARLRHRLRAGKPGSGHLFVGRHKEGMQLPGLPFVRKKKEQDPS
ncbi:MAG: class I SAM-dependent methyltransferase [Candidatus Sumerlaeia bacterium]|nr:class I SAM-dependent methyltransferase [Candidatus Sumerlaeia bacterium]